MQNWEKVLAAILSELFAVWKEVYNLAREDATRKACATQLLRKYIQALMGDARAQAISSWRSNKMQSGGNFLNDEEKDRIFADALSRAKVELPFIWESEVGS